MKIKRQIKQNDDDDHHHHCRCHRRHRHYLQKTSVAYKKIMCAITVELWVAFYTNVNLCA